MPPSRRLQSSYSNFSAQFQRGQERLRRAQEARDRLNRIPLPEMTSRQARDLAQLDRAIPALQSSLERYRGLVPGERVNPRTMREELGRAARRTAGMLVGGPAAMADMVSNAVRATSNITGLSEAVTGRELPMANLRGEARAVVGAPEPENAFERVTDLVGEGVSGGGPVLGLGRSMAARGSSELTRRVGTAIADYPLAEATGGAGAGLAQGLAAEAGAGPLGQTIAAIAGGLGGGASGAMASARRGPRTTELSPNAGAVISRRIDDITSRYERGENISDEDMSFLERSTDLLQGLSPAPRAEEGSSLRLGYDRSRPPEAANDADYSNLPPGYLNDVVDQVDEALVNRVEEAPANPITRMDDVRNERRDAANRSRAEDVYWRFRHLLDSVKAGERPITPEEFREVREESGLDDIVFRARDNGKPVEIHEDIMSVMDEIERVMAIRAANDNSYGETVPPRVDFIPDPVNRNSVAGIAANDVDPVPTPTRIEPDAPVSTYDENGKLVGRYRTIQQARDLKPNHIYVDEHGNRISDNPNEQTAAARQEEPNVDELPVFGEGWAPSLREYLADVVDEDANYYDVADDVVPPAGGGRGGDEPPEPPRGGDGGDDGNPPEGGGPDDPIVPGPGVIARLTAALNKAQRLSREQGEARRETRAQRLARMRGVREGTSGEEGYRAELATLKGELPRADFEAIRDQFTPGEVKSLFDYIKNYEGWGNDLFAPLNARTGLLKLLEGRVPTDSELSLLRRAFPEELIDAALSKRSNSRKLMDYVSNILNLPRSLMSSVDLSAPLRQGVFLIHKGEFWRALPSMIRSLASEKQFQALQQNIRERPSFGLMQEAKLAIMDPDGHNLTAREEDFMSPWAEKIPLLGRAVRASNRAYTGFLNKLRADVFDSFLRTMRENGMDPDEHMEIVRQMGHFINAASGRGDLFKMLKPAAPILTGLLFSPRLMSSRMTLLNPAYYMTRTPMVRREAIRALVSYGTYVSSVLTLAAMSGLDVELDPRSSDFGKIRDGDTRYDIMGGFGQYITLASRIASNQTKSLTGEVRTYGEGFRADTALDAIGTFARNKASPVASYIVDFLDRSNAIGEPFDPVSDTAERFIPMFVRDVYEETMGPQGRGAAGVLTAAPALVGIGVQTFDTPEAYDVFGRNFHDVPGTERDSAIVEANRLAEGQPRRLLTQAGPSANGRTLTPEQRAEYARVSGQYILNDMREAMADPVWRELSDEERRREIRLIIEDARSQARDELFPRADDPQPVEAEGEGPVEEEEPVRASPGEPVVNAASIIRSIFPGVRINEEYRDPNSPLGRAFPDSWHTRGTAAVDVAPIPGMTYQQFISGIVLSGYDLIEARDEVTNPSRHATGPHWHVVLREPR